MAATGVKSKTFTKHAEEAWKLRAELLDEYITRGVGSARRNGVTAVVTAGPAKSRQPEQQPEERKKLFQKKFKRMLELEEKTYKNPGIDELPPFDEAAGDAKPGSITLQALDPEERNARAVVLILHKELLPFDPESRTYRFAQTLTAQQFFRLCDGEPFADQITARGEGSGFLVAQRSILTAAHCVDERWQDLYFVFDFLRKKDGSARTEFGVDDVYEAEQIVKKDATLPGDWALVRLKRDVVGREPVPLRRSGKIRLRQPVYVIGHPLTLPKKKSKGGKVRFNREVVTFTANLNVFGGNSGSPVFNQDTHEVEGVLVDGSVDFIRCPTCTPACRRALIWPDSGGMGEIATRITEVLKIVRDEDLV